MAGSAGVLPTGVLAQVASILGHTVDDVAAMTLATFTGSLFDVDGSASAGADPFSPALVIGGPYCVLCVADGFFDIRWKTGLAVACEKHQVYLVARCSRCGAAVAPDTLQLPVDRARRAVTHGPTLAGSCTLVLPEHGVRAAVRHLHLQHRLNVLLDNARSDVTAAARCRDVLRWAEYLNRAVSARAYIAGGYLALDGPDLAELLDTALSFTAHHVGEPVPAALTAAALLQQARGRNALIPPRYQPLLTSSPDPVLELHAQVQDVLGEPVAAPFPGFRGDLARMPQVAPASCLSTDITDVLDFVGPDRLRLLTAVAIAAPPGLTRWSKLAADMSLNAAVGGQLDRALRYLEWQGRLDQFWDAAGDVRAAVTARGIDYQERAHLLLDSDAVVNEALTCWPALREVPPATVRQWLLDRWAGQYVGQLPSGLDAQPQSFLDGRHNADAIVASDIDPDDLWATWRPRAERTHASG